MKTRNVILAKAGIQSFAAPWMPRHAREGGDCAGMTILAAVMINSRLDKITALHSIPLVRSVFLQTIPG
jgi:hypothetical protein